MSNKKQIIYDLIFAILAIIAITITILDLAGKVSLETNTPLRCIDNAILYTFIADYFIRLIFAKDKKHFFKTNIPDLIAIIPFNSLFKVFRIAKLLRLTKLSKVTKLTKLTKLIRFFGVSGKFYKYAKKFLKKNGLIYMLLFTVIVIIFGAIGLSVTESYSFSDSIWWSFVTATTVGYGDFAPATHIGRIIAAILMIVGIGTIGMLTGTIATFFLTEEKNIDNSKPIENLISQCTDLTDIEKEKLIDYANYLLSNR